VIERCRREIPVLIRDPEQVQEPGAEQGVQRIAGRPARERTPHSLRSSRRARGVEHDGALELAVEPEILRHVGHGLLERHEARDLAAHREAPSEPRHGARHVGRNGSETRVSHQQLGVGVVDDVLDLVTLQVPVDRREEEAHPVARPEQVEEDVVIGEVRRYAVAGLEAEPPQHMPEPPRALLERAVGDFVLAVPVDEGRSVRMLLCDGGNGRHGVAPLSRGKGPRLFWRGSMPQRGAHMSQSTPGELRARDARDGHGSPGKGA